MKIKPSLPSPAPPAPIEVGNPIRDAEPTEAIPSLTGAADARTALSLILQDELAQDELAPLPGLHREFLRTQMENDPLLLELLGQAMRR